ASQQLQAKQQNESGIVQNLVERYNAFKNIFKDNQDNIDDWLPDPETGLNIFDVIGNSINMMEQQVTQVNLVDHPADILLEPDLSDCGIFDFHQAKPTIQQGYDAAKAMLPQIKQALETSHKN
ncbi:MAG TPA: patatin-like phospholipase family protein, partial [Xenococcaceae cyanobacterium]